MPYLEKGGLKSQVIIPKHSRNPYDIGIAPAWRRGGRSRNAGATRGFDGATNCDDLYPVFARGSQRPAEHCEYLQGGQGAGTSLCLWTRRRKNLTIPNIHLAAGATVVGYSGGKCMRGPQCAGLLLGRKELVQAAWFQAAPHHNVGRSLKVGKEEIMGMLAAVEMWTKRDHEAEWNTWKEWLGNIEAKVKPLPSVTTEYHHARGSVESCAQAADQVGWQYTRRSPGGAGEDAGRGHSSHPVR